MSEEMEDVGGGGGLFGQVDVWKKREKEGDEGGAELMWRNVQKCNIHVLDYVAKNWEGLFLL